MKLLCPDCFLAEKPVESTLKQAALASTACIVRACCHLQPRSADTAAGGHSCRAACQDERNGEGGEL